MALLKQIQLELSKHGCRALRVNVGEGWTGQSARMPNGDVIIRNARRFQTGVPKGFPDLLVICPGGKVIFMEIKTPQGQLSADQKRFHEILRRWGQHTTVCRSVEEAIKAIGE